MNWTRIETYSGHWIYQSETKKSFYCGGANTSVNRLFRKIENAREYIGFCNKHYGE